MQSDAATVQEYLDSLPADRREAVAAVRDTINAHLPDGYEEVMAWGMITWQIPLADYPDTYNKKPLVFASLASQKRHLAVYLMSLYADSDDEAWFRQQYDEAGLKLDMGKSCVLFRSLDDVLLPAVAGAVARVPAAAFIDRYEQARAIKR